MHDFRQLGSQSLGPMLWIYTKTAKSILITITTKPPASPLKRSYQYHKKRIRTLRPKSLNEGSIGGSVGEKYIKKYVFCCIFGLIIGLLMVLNREVMLRKGFQLYVQLINYVFDFFRFRQTNRTSGPLFTAEILQTIQEENQHNLNTFLW